MYDILASGKPGKGELMNRETKRFSLTLDMVRTIRSHPFEVVDGDTGNMLEIRLENDGVPVDLTGRYVCMVFRSCIGTALQDADSGIALGPKTGAFTIDLLPGSYGPGNVSADVQVYSGADRGTLITSTRFTFRCRNALLNGETMRAQATYPPLVAATREATAATEAARAAAEAAAAAADALEAPVVEIGTVMTGEAGTAASVENVGTGRRAVLNFSIPQGVQGPAGPQGPQGEPGGLAAHVHTAADITGGVLPLARGGLGADTEAGARSNLGTNMQTFYTLEQLGLTRGEETLPSIYAALPDGGRLVFRVAADCAAIYPTSYGVFSLEKTGTYARLLFVSVSSTAGAAGASWAGAMYGAEVFSGWKFLPQARSMTRNTLSISSTSSNASFYWKNDANEVGLVIQCKVNATLSAGTQIGTLPAGYRPTATLLLPMSYKEVRSLRIYSDGKIDIANGSVASGEYIGANAVFPT